MSATDNRPAWFLLTRHWLSLLGVALLATALISWLFVLPQQVRGHVDNPYVGIVVFLVLPAIFFTGLALVPIGIYLSKRQIRKGLAEAVFDRKIALQRIVWFFGVNNSAEHRHWNPSHLPRRQAHGDATILRSDLSHDEP